MNSITITYGSTTQSIQDWGFTYCTLHLKSRAASTLILDKAGADPAGAAEIPYGGIITVTIALGDGGNYVWQGKRRDFNGRAHPEAPATSLQFEDVWGALERTTFQHFWAMSDGSGGVTNKYFSRLNLFQDIHAGPLSDWVYLTADNQIKQIIDFAHTECGLPVQYGDVDPIWNMPVFAVKAISCAYALQLVMKPMPDMVTKMDYSTTPPTIHFKQRQNCTPVTLPFGGTDAHGRHHTQTQIKPRPDLQVPSVVVQYQITGTIDGTSYNDTSTDAYPPGATGLEENALVFPVDLRGPSRNSVKGTLVTEAIDPTSPDFWKDNKPDLDDPNIASLALVNTSINDGSHADGIKIVDADDMDVTLADFPNKLLSGQPAAWMTVTGGGAVVAKEVTIRATLSYTKNDPATGGTAIHKPTKHVVEVRMRLTNAPAGTTNYSTTGSSENGDPIPLYLAYAMWCAINNVPVNYVDGIAAPAGTVPPGPYPAGPGADITSPENFQWEGEHEIVEKTIYEIVTPANVLNLSGGNTDWESMNAVIYSVDVDFFRGDTHIQFGPFKHLQAAEYFEMVMAFRYRQVFDNPALRNNGQAGSAGATDIGKDSPKENTVHGIPQQSLHTVQAENGEIDTNQNYIHHDAENNGGQIIVWTKDSTGSVNASFPQVQLANNDLGTTDSDDGPVGRVAKWRLFGVCDSAGAAKQAMFAASDPEDIS